MDYFIAVYKKDIFSNNLQVLDDVLYYQSPSICTHDNLISEIILNSGWKKILWKYFIKTDSLAAVLVVLPEVINSCLAVYEC